MRKTKLEILETYKQLMTGAIDNDDEEIGHMRCDAVLCDLLIELGYGEIITIYEEQCRWFA